MRKLTIVMGVLLLLSAALQYNDPDPLRWTIIYLAATALSFQAAFRSPPPWGLPIGIGLVAAMWAGALATGVNGVAYRHVVDEFGMASVEIEEAREVLGLMIISIWMAVLARWSYTHRS